MTDIDDLLHSLRRGGWRDRPQHPALAAAVTRFWDGIADPSRPSPTEVALIDRVRAELGAYHAMQIDNSATDHNDAHLARAIYLLAGPTAPVPLTVANFIGPTATSLEQARAGARLIKYLGRRQDSVAAAAAVIILTDAVASADTRSMASRLGQLALAHRLRFELSGGHEDLHSAIDLGHRAVALSSSSPQASRAARMCDLGVAHRIRAEVSGSLTDAETAVEIGLGALRAAPPEAAVHVACLAMVGLAFLRRFELQGREEDLDEAINHGRRALAATPPGDAGRPGRLSNLAIAYHLRFQCVGHFADIDAAVALLRIAISASPENEPARALFEANLAAAYDLRFRRARGPGALTDLRQAIQHGEQALAATPRTDKTHVAGRLFNLGMAYRVWFENTQRASALDRAIDLITAAAAEVAAGTPAWAQYTSSLAMAHRLAFKASGDAEHGRRAVDLAERALAAVSPGNAYRPLYLVNLAFCHTALMEQNAHLDDERLTRHLVDVATLPETVPVGHRLLVNLVMGKLAFAVGREDLAIQYLRAAVELLPVVASRQLARPDRERVLALHRHVVADAVGACLAAGEETTALALVEGGRVILMSDQLGQPVDTAALHFQAPELLERLTHVRAELNHGVFGRQSERRPVTGLTALSGPKIAAPM